MPDPILPRPINPTFISHRPYFLPARYARSLVTDAPDRPVAVFCDKQGTVDSDGYTDRAAPHLLIGYDEARHEIFVYSCRFSGVVEKEPYNLVTGPFAAVP